MATACSMRERIRPVDIRESRRSVLNDRRLENIAGGVNADDSKRAVLKCACAGRVEDPMRVQRFALLVAGLAVTSACLATDYHVGDGQPYPTIAAVPWQSFLP